MCSPCHPAADRVASAHRPRGASSDEEPLVADQPRGVLSHSCSRRAPSRGAPGRLFMGLSATAFPPMTVVCGCTFAQQSPAVPAICPSAVGALPSSVILEPRRARETGRVIAQHAALSFRGGPDCSVDVGLLLEFLGLCRAGCCFCRAASADDMPA